MSPAGYRVVEISAIIAGGVVVLAGIALADDRNTQLAVAVAGLLITQIGRLKLGRPTYSVDRRFQALRREVDHFILLVRRLNAAALGARESESAPARQVFETTQQKMRESFDRMALLAGRTDEEVAELNLTDVYTIAD